MCARLLKQCLLLKCLTIELTFTNIQEKTDFGIISPILTNVESTTLNCQVSYMQDGAFSNFSMQIINKITPSDQASFLSPT